MKQLYDWVVPDREEVGIRDILNEWDNKEKEVISRVSKRNRAVQAGGHVGVFPLGLSKHFKNVTTFEPVQENWECLLQNTKDNNKISKFQFALSNANHTASVSHTIENNCGAVQLHNDKEGSIQAVTLDSILGEQEVNLLWLDLEGFEAKALQGAANIIEKHRPVIVIENNGLIPEFPSDKRGSEELRIWVEKTFDYIFQSRLMRDDLFIPRSDTTWTTL